MASLTAFRRWLLRHAAGNATSPEDYRCILAPGHKGSHIPEKGRGWAWGGNYGRMPR